MRVDAQTGRAIIHGRITARLYKQTRRPYQPDTTTPLHYPQTVTDSYGQPVRTTDGAPKIALATTTVLRITATRRIPLGEIDVFTAGLLGHHTVTDLHEWFDQQFNWRPNKTTGEREHFRTIDRSLTIPVWVVYFEPEHIEHARYLAAVTGYISNPHLSVDPEAPSVDPAIIAQLPGSEAAHRRWRHARNQDAERRSRMPIAQQVDLALREAQAAGLTTTAVEFAIRRQLNKLERATRRDAA